MIIYYETCVLCTYLTLDVFDHFHSPPLGTAAADDGYLIVNQNTTEI